MGGFGVVVGLLVVVLGACVVVLGACEVGLCVVVLGLWVVVLGDCIVVVLPNSPGGDMVAEGLDLSLPSANDSALNKRI